jgi:hypothetical protein
MVHRRLVAVLTIVLLNVVVVGCAGPTTGTGVVLTDSTASSASAAGLSGTWHGYFLHPGADFTSSPGSTDLTLQVRDDSTYTFKWGNRAERTGTVVANGNRVYLNDSSGSQATFVHSGGTLYGGMKDIVPPGRVVMVSLKKDETAVDHAAASTSHPTMRSRLCEAAGGTYSDDLCEPKTNPDLGARCAARGGTYFAGGDYCEVPAGGLRPS